MKSKLKYIKIHGVLKSRGEYTDTAESRLYEAVTIVDSDGVEIHFVALSISKRLDEELALGQPMVFYVLRYRADNKMIGALFALKVGERNIYYPESAVAILKSFAIQTSGRYQVALHSPKATIGAMAAGGGFLWGLLAFFGLGADLSFLLGFVGFGAYLLSPLFVGKSRRAGIQEMQEILTADGFDVLGAENAKY